MLQPMVDHQCNQMIKKRQMGALMVKAHPAMVAQSPHHPCKAGLEGCNSAFHKFSVEASSYPQTQLS